MLRFHVKNKILFIVVLIFLMLVNTSCKNDKAVPPVSRTKFLLDTVCSVTIYDKTNDKIFDECFKRIEDIEKKMSVDIADSEVSEINRNAGVKAVRVSDDTYYVIRSGKKYCEETEGKFDITVGPLVKLWGINTPHEKIPSVNEIRSTVSLINYKNIILNDKEKSVFLKEKGMSLDLGGIAKGYAGDAAARVLRKNNVKHAIVNLGGNIVVIGSKSEGTAWKVGIQTPFKPRGDYLGVVNVSDTSIVTSGIYERYFKKDGKIYDHILDTSAGYPIDNGLVSVTIINKKSMDSDALAKVFTLGLDKGMKFIESLKGVEAIFVTKESKVYITPGLKNSFKVVNPDYILAN